MDQGDDIFAGWAILELMGHRRLAGHVSFTLGLLRIDIPSTPAVTQFYGMASIYCLTPTTEEIAKALAQQLNTQPVNRYELPGPATGSPACCDCEAKIHDGQRVFAAAGGRLRCLDCQRAIDES
jgi:hypothetical protein